MSSPSVPPTIPQYRVSIWEGIAIAAGAVLLVVVGVAGLGIKALNNAFDPQRAEAIAHSMADYAIPGGSKGLFGTNVGGGRMAVVGSDSTLKLVSPTASTMPEVELLIARIPIQADTEADEDNDDWGTELFFSGFSFSNQTVDAFQIATTHTEQIAFCGAISPVKIEEGRLATADQTSVPAVRYETKVSIENEDHIAIVSAVGQRASEKAELVFQSIKCR
ncbi:hypothetical protein IFO70_04995 [Phormidium tenue FACHB-886]|nr:hypothetical protein [Phormidium tenue FACHB-886]